MKANISFHLIEPMKSDRRVKSVRVSALLKLIQIIAHAKVQVCY